MTEGTRTCTLCREPKPLDCYDLHGTRPGKLHPRCKSCRADQAAARYSAHKERIRAGDTRRLYRDHAGTIDDLRQTQGGRCALCGDVPADEALCVDHDHATGAIRALLCRRCNLGLGHLRDDVELMRRAADYVEAHRNATKGAT